jgi:hypothetical protein
MSPVKANAEVLAEEAAKAKKINDERGSAKGTRIRVGQTRGKSPSVITWEAFDLEKPETLPADFPEFADLSGLSAMAETERDKTHLSYCIDGYNDAQYSQASDEIGEYVEDYWDKDTQGQFRVVIRNYAKVTGMSIEDAVVNLKPSIDAAFKARKAALASAPSASQTEATASV